MKSISVVLLLYVAFVQELLSNKLQSFSEWATVVWWFRWVILHIRHSLRRKWTGELIMFWFLMVWIPMKRMWVSALVGFTFTGLLKLTGQYQNIQILKFLSFCTEKYKHEFIDIDWTCELDINWTSSCISQYKTKKHFVFDLLIWHLLIFIFILKSTQIFPCDVVPRQSKNILKRYRFFVLSLGRGQLFLFLSHENSDNLFSLW